MGKRSFPANFNCIHLDNFNENVFDCEQHEKLAIDLCAIFPVK